MKPQDPQMYDTFLMHRECLPTNHDVIYVFNIWIKLWSLTAVMNVSVIPFLAIHEYKFTNVLWTNTIDKC